MTKLSGAVPVGNRSAGFRSPVVPLLGKAGLTIGSNPPFTRCRISKPISLAPCGRMFTVTTCVSVSPSASLMVMVMSRLAEGDGAVVRNRRFSIIASTSLAVVCWVNTISGPPSYVKRLPTSLPSIRMVPFSKVMGDPPSVRRTISSPEPTPETTRLPPSRLLSPRKDTSASRRCPCAACAGVRSKVSTISVSVGT